MTDIKSSSTAWLLIQALLSEYEEEEAHAILAGIYENAGPHIEDSGSGPIKKVRSGEVAIGFGLRHQAVADKNDGMPIDYIDRSKWKADSLSANPPWQMLRKTGFYQIGKAYVKIV